MLGDHSRKRPLWRWPIVAATLSWFVSGWLMYRSMCRQPLGPDPLNLLVIPPAAFCVAAAVGLFVWASQRCLSWWRLSRPRKWSAGAALAALTLTGTSAACIYLGITFWQEQRVLEEVEGLHLDHAAPNELTAFLKDSPFRENPCALSIIASRRDVPGALLDHIGRMKAASLHGVNPPCLGVNVEGHTVMQLVAMHPSVESRTLEVLSRSGNEYERHVVAMNSKLPQPTMYHLLEENNYLLNWGIASNTRAPRDILERLATDSNRYTRGNVAKNASTPPELLARLASDADPVVRLDLIANPTCSVELLTRLSQDEDASVRDFAQRQLLRR